MADAKYVFLPWVRQGAVSGIQTPDMSATQAGVVSVTVQLRVNDTEPIGPKVRLYGPGDVIGIDPQQVVRTEPRHLATDFKPNYFPLIEFDRPDFPWLFTPAKANDAGKLRPWLCLVVVRKQAGVTLHKDSNRPLPVLEINESAQPMRELPDLAEAWAWAHVQVTPRENDSLANALAGDPALTVSRLLCPRQLDPLTDYLACVVPTFELGCKAGLGLSITSADEEVLKPAWAFGGQSPPQVSPLPVTLPVYFHWEFRTGTGDDFEALVRSLVAGDARTMLGVGKRPMDISQLLPSPTTLDLEGALRVPGAPTADWSEDTRTQFQTALTTMLNAPWQAMKEEAEAGKEPLLAPPIYGSWQAARHTVEMTRPPIPPPLPPWLHELNLDPRHRAVAALGTQVVQREQEPLMAAAWEQLGEIERVNQIRRQAQLARAVNAIYYTNHFSRFSDETLLKVVASAQAHVVIEATDATQPRALLSQRIAQSTLPARAVSAPLRRLTSARGPIRTRFRPVGALPVGAPAADTPTGGILTKLITTTIVQFQKKEAGLVTIDQVSDQMIPLLAQAVRFDQASHALETAPPLSGFQIMAEGSLPLASISPRQVSENFDEQAFRGAAQAHQDYLMQEAFESSRPPPPPPSLDFLSSTKVKLLQNLHPEKTIAARVQAVIKTASVSGQNGDPLESILDAPTFPHPMYEALRELSQDFLLPGLEHVPPNTVTLLETNAKFVEAFLVGLNTEMSRELLWRGYPTDQRGTYFRQFWGSGQTDIDRINQWGNQSLGKNARKGGDLVLLIRGELLRRYPNSVIYAVAAVRENGKLKLSDPVQERHPIFRGTLKPDVTFLGFALTCEEAIADPGWFLVIQEQPTEPRFGLDEADFRKELPALTTWDDLSWRHLANTAEALKALSHVSVKTVLPVQIIKNMEWGRNASHQAYITLQRPVRIAIHASALIARCTP